MDTAGQERFDAIIPMLFRGAHALVLVYDVTIPRTFANLDRWLKQVKEHVQEKNTMVMVLGNKNDLQQKMVSREEGQKFADEHDFFFFETSASTGQNITEAFQHFARQLKHANNNPESTHEAFGLDDGGEHNQPQGKGCSIQCTL